MFRLKGQTESGEWMEFGITELFHGENGYFQVCVEDVGLFAIDPATIEAVVDGGQRKNDFDYVIRNYGVPACVERRVIVYGKPGTIVEARGNYIGIHLDGDPSDVVRNYHPTDGIIYFGPGIFKDQCEALLGEIRKGLKGLIIVQGKGLPLGYPCEWVDKILDEMEAKL